MSSVADNRIHPRTVVALKEKSTLILSKEFLLKVHYLHHRVNRGIEWSGILIYKVVSGDIKDPSTLVLEAEDLIPMNVGTSGYTEYEITPDDTFAFDNWTSALASGKKIGHCHTHHTMGTFFSGTDMSELHDNAPNHNYYLSLIVDYKEVEDWKAKIAVCGAIEQTGIKETTGFMKTVRKMLGTSGEETVEEVEDLSAKEEISNSMQVLYTIDCDLVLKEEDGGKAFQQRVTELTKPKYTSYMHTAGATGYNRTVGLHTPTSSVGKTHTPLNQQSGAKNPVNTVKTPTVYSAEEDDFPIEFSFQDDDSNAALPDYEAGSMTPGKIKSLLTDLLSLEDDCKETLAKIVFQLNSTDNSTLEIMFSAIEDRTEDAVAEFMGEKGRPDYVQMHCFAVAAMDLLAPYKHLKVYGPLLELFEVFILPPTTVSSFETKRITGIPYSDYSHLLAI